MKNSAMAQGHRSRSGVALRLGGCRCDRRNDDDRERDVERRDANDRRPDGTEAFGDRRIVPRGGDRGHVPREPYTGGRAGRGDTAVHSATDPTTANTVEEAA